MEYEPSCCLFLKSRRAYMFPLQYPHLINPPRSRLSSGCLLFRLASFLFLSARCCAFSANSFDMIAGMGVITCSFGVVLRRGSFLPLTLPIRCVLYCISSPQYPD